MENKNACRDLFLQAFFIQLSGKRGSNPRPSAWEADALPLSYSRLFCEAKSNKSIHRVYVSRIIFSGKISEIHLVADHFNQNPSLFNQIIHFRSVFFSQIQVFTFLNYRFVKLK